MRVLCACGCVMHYGMNLIMLVNTVGILFNLIKPPLFLREEFHSMARLLHARANRNCCSQNVEGILELWSKVGPTSVELTLTIPKAYFVDTN